MFNVSPQTIDNIDYVTVVYIIAHAQQKLTTPMYANGVSFRGPYRLEVKSLESSDREGRRSQC